MYVFTITGKSVVDCCNDWIAFNDGCRVYFFHCHFAMMVQI